MSHVVSSSEDEQLACFNLLATVNNTAKSREMQLIDWLIDWLIEIWSPQTGLELLGSVILSLPSAGTTGMSHHAFMNIFKFVKYADILNMLNMFKTFRQLML